MIAEINWTVVNTCLGSFILLVTVGGTLATAFRAKSAREAASAAQETARSAKDALEIVRVELGASNSRADRLEAEKNEFKAERDDYREKLHTEQNVSHAAQLENAVLKERTDFTPIEELLRTTSADSAKMNKEVLGLISNTGAVLARVTTMLEKVEAKL